MSETKELTGIKKYFAEQNISITYQRIAIDGLGGMAHGLFASLLIVRFSTPSAATSLTSPTLFGVRRSRCWQTATPMPPRSRAPAWPPLSPTI